MTEERQTAHPNLRRGGGSANIQETMEAIKAQEQLIDGSNDPSDVVVELFKESAKATIRGLRKTNRTRDEASRNLIEQVRETRQLCTSVFQLLQARGAATQTDGFFATLDARLEVLASRLGKGVRPHEPVGRRASP